MDKEKISVIVPVYKVEQYLDKCVQSIVDQTYKNLEIILIDDGSPDNCPKMCDVWANKDPRIKVIHKENGGLSDARNCGLSNMTGQYIVFVDSDDYLDKNFCTILYSNLVKYDADVAICDYVTFKENDDVQTDLTDEHNVLDFCKNRFELLKKYNTQAIVAWGKIYKKEVFKDIRYPKGKIYEDGYVAHKYLYAANKVIYIEQKLYYYLQRSNSIMGKNKKIFRRTDLEAFIDRIQFLQFKNVDKCYINDSRVSYLNALLNSLKKQEVSKEDKKYIRKEIIRIHKELKANKYNYSLKEKIKLFAFIYFNINLVRG